MTTNITAPTNAIPNLLVCFVLVLKAQVLFYEDDCDAAGALFIEDQYFVQAGVHTVSLLQALIFQRQDIFFDPAQAFIQILDDFLRAYDPNDFFSA